MISRACRYGVVCLIVVCCCIGFVVGCSDDDDDGGSSPVSPFSATCSCTSNIYNCSDFQSSADAQLCFDHCLPIAGDIHALDADDDLLACEDFWK